MSHRRDERDELTDPWHNVGRAIRGIRDPPPRPHHYQSIQECYIVGLTPQLANCSCGLSSPFSSKPI
jgi:hypothetical protein